MTDERACLHCGETKASIKAQGLTLCGIMEGYYEPELAEEWPRHRWVDWTNRDLSRAGIRPDAFEKHRRTLVRHLQWAGCEDIVRGHSLLTQEEIDADAAEFSPRLGTWHGMVAGQCVLCGKLIEGSTE